MTHAVQQSPAAKQGDNLTFDFGLISVPVKLLSRIDDKAGKVTRKMQAPSGNTVTQVMHDTVTNDPVDRADIVMVTETDDGWIPLTEDEMVEAHGFQKDWAELVGVYDAKLFDGNAFMATGNYEIVPQTNQQKRIFDKPVALFLQALKDTKKVAVVKYFSRGALKMAVLRGDGTAQMLHFANEYRQAAEWPVPTLTSKERALAKTLINGIADDSPEFALPENDLVTKVRQYVNAKAAGKLKSIKTKPKQATANDVMAALEASISKKA